MKRNYNVTPMHSRPNPSYRPTRHWDALDEQMEREANALRGRMTSAGQLKTVNETEKEAAKRRFELV